MTEGVCRPRVLMFAPDPRDPGGITRAIQSWRAAGIDRCADLEVVSTSAWDAPVALQGLQALRALLVLVARLLNPRTRPHAVHVHVSTGGSLYRKACLGAIARLARVPVIVHLHSGAFEVWVKARRWRAVIAGWLIRHAASVVLVASVWRPLAESFGARSTCVIPGVLDDPSVRALDQVAERRRQMVRDDSHRLLLYYGRWTPTKGLDLLAAATRELAPHERARLAIRIHGNGDRAWLDGIFAGLDGLDLSVGGWLEGRAKLDELARADAVILASRHEGFGQSLVEAMAACVPIIASDAGAIPEVTAGYPGVRLFPRGSVEGLLGCLRDLISGGWPRQPAADGVPTGLPAHLDADTVVSRFGILYSEVVRSYASHCSLAAD